MSDERIKQICDYVCKSVSESIKAHGTKEMSPDVSYNELICKKGHSKTSINISRAICIKILHDKYCMSYSEICKIFNISTKQSAMRMVRLVRETAKNNKIIASVLTKLFNNNV